jgi:hypothetical protein
MDEQTLHISLGKARPAAAPPPAEPLTGPLRSFCGDPEQPFLAPRGIWLCGSRLLVSDTGQNRVLIWNRLPEAPQQPADVILGQPDAETTGRQDAAGASSLQYPSGIWSDGVRLIVADAWNHRVLIWHRFPEQHGQPADVVVGQPDMTGNQPNITGVGAAPSLCSLYWPYGVCSDGTRLWIADTGNRRILVYDQIPDTSGEAASRVIGQPDGGSREYDPAWPLWPYSVRVGPQGELAVADPQAYRILLWPRWQDAGQEPARTVIGQPDLVQNGMNQYGLYPAAHTLSWCYDCCFSGGGLLAADTGNSRILWFDPLPAQSGAAAAHVIGKADFTTGSENLDTVFGTAQTLYWPFSLCVSGGRIAIADTGNHRIMLASFPR